MSLVDGLLLQRRESYFTGGFLSDDHLRGSGEIAAFTLLSLLADAAVVGLLAGLVMWVCRRMRLTVRATTVAGALAGVAPLLIADVISYELLRYLGDALDLSLAMELTGGSIAEILAVSSSHLVLPAVAIAGIGGMGGALIWLVHRYGAGEPASRSRATVLALPILLWIIALGTTVVANTINDTIANGLLRKPSGRLFSVLGNELTDIDGDGFGLGGRLSDPAPRDAAVFPFAVDIPGNGIDENGVAGDLPWGGPPYVEGQPSSERWDARPDVLLIVLESFRADLLGAEYRGRPVTPVLNALASRGVSSARAYSPNGYTAQSRFHLFSGSVAGLRSGTLIDDFRANGYYVAYFSSQDESFGGSRYDVGFSRADVAYDARSDRALRYSTFTTAGSLAGPADVLEQRIQTFLAEDHAASKPLFMYANFHDAHFPYAHDGVRSIVSSERLPRHAISPDARDALWSTYVNTAANVDQAVGTLIERVRAARGREPAVIVTADHGESLYDDGFLGHGHALNDVQTRVPLVVANLPMVIGEPFSHVDLRDALGRALQATMGAPPSVRSSGRSVFQYLGTVDRPRQIAFFRDNARIIYDFRTDRVQVDGGDWRPPEALESTKREEFQQLVWHWERMRLARARVNE